MSVTSQEGFTVRYLIKELVLGATDSVALTVDEFEAIATAHREMKVILSVEGKFGALIENYFDLQQDMFSISMRGQAFDGWSLSKTYADVNLLNRRLMNLLTTCRSYVDQVGQDLRSTGELGDARARRFKEERARHYDTSFSYRFMEEMRNYVQHRGFPLSGILKRSRLLDVDRRELGLEFSLGLTATVESLLADRRFKKKVSSGLIGIQGKIDVGLRVRDYVALLAEVHCGLREELSPVLDSADAVISSAIVRYGCCGSECPPGLYAVEEDVTGECVKKLWLNYSSGLTCRSEMKKYAGLSAILRQRVVYSSGPI